MTQSNTVLVTGGAGYIGSHACKLLASRGLEPVVFDNLVHGHREAVKWGPLEVGDLADADRLDEVFKRHKPGAVLHFAAFAYVGESVKDPGKYFRNNVGGTLSLLDAMVRHHVDRIVFSSTCATYGIPLSVPITEDHPQKPINPYGATKLMAERMLDDFGDAYGIKSAALRYFNAAGADPDGEIGESHDPETHLIPLVLDVALGREKEIGVFGDDYETPDGTCIRDYIHVCDLAEAHWLALRRLEEKEGSPRLNLGNGTGYSVKEVIAAAEKVTGKKIPIRMEPRRAGDPARLVGDASRAKSVLGWAPRFAELETILEHAWNWSRKRHGAG